MARNHICKQDPPGRGRLAVSRTCRNASVLGPGRVQRCTTRQGIVVLRYGIQQGILVLHQVWRFGWYLAACIVCIYILYITYSASLRRPSATSARLVQVVPPIDYCASHMNPWRHQMPLKKRYSTDPPGRYPIGATTRSARGARGAARSDDWGGVRRYPQGRASRGPARGLMTLAAPKECTLFRSPTPSLNRGRYPNIHPSPVFAAFPPRLIAPSLPSITCHLT